jgi:hypothetical protein
MSGKQSTSAGKRSEQDRRLQELVIEENQRLDRFIRNLHLKFALSHYRPEELYDHICRSAAEYFGSDCAMLHLKEHYLSDEHVPAASERLVLVGATGAWARVLHPLHFRRKPRIYYDLPANGEPGDFTSYLCNLKMPEVFPHREAFEQARAQYSSGRPRPEDRADERPEERDPDLAPHQVAWPQQNLHHTCRNIAGAPLRRQSLLATTSKWAAGVLKVENRAPRRHGGYKAGAYDELYLRDLWSLLALRPYVRDLATSPDPYEPLGNNYSWNRYFAEIPATNRHFQNLLDWLSERKKQHCPEFEVKESIKRFARRLGELLDFVAEAEALFQNLDYVRQLAQNLSDHQPGFYEPSLFNVGNLLSACWSTECDGEFSEKVCRLLLDELHNPKRWVDQAVEALFANQGGSLPEPRRWLAKKELGLNVESAVDKLFDLFQSLAVGLNGIELPGDLAPGVDTEARYMIRLATDTVRLIGKDKEVSGITRLANFSAHAAMFVHTFNETKEQVRLMYVGQHVMQVLDQQLLQRARHLGVPASPDDLALLHLDSFGLTCLAQLKVVADEVLEALAYELERRLAREQPCEPKIALSPLNLEGFLLALCEAAREAAQVQSPLPIPINLLQARIVLPPGDYQAITKGLAEDMFTSALYKSASSPSVDHPWAILVYPRSKDLELTVLRPTDPLAYQNPSWLLELLYQMRVMHNCLCVVTAGQCGDERR